jgi:hypothetical protein
MEITHRPDLSAAQTASANRSVNGFYGTISEPKYFVHIYNIAPKEFPISRTLFPRFTARACPAGERYIKVTSIRHPFPELDHESDDTSQIRIREHIAERVAQDICNPENTTLDQNLIVQNSFNIDGNLNLQGLFWSRNNPPTEAELKDAEKRLETYYRGLLSMATALERTNEKELYERKTPDWHDAADYFGVETSWHQKQTRKVEVAKHSCPNCGDDIKAGAAFHRDSEGDLCILDWQRAYEAGRVTKEQVPESKIWWTVEAPVEVVKPSKK